jgi:hypothetical protein
MTEDRKLTREERIDLLRRRVKKDGTPFAKPEGPRKTRAISPNGLRIALDKIEDTQHVAFVRSFGADGKKALQHLAKDDPKMRMLLEAAFASGRMPKAEIRVTQSGYALVSGFPPGGRVSVTRLSDGGVMLNQVELDLETNPLSDG